MKTGLQGLRVLNTRPQDQAEPTSQAIRAAGGQVIALPCLAIQALPPDWLIPLGSLDRYDLAIFISQNAVNYFFRQLPEPWPSDLVAVAIGQATAEALNAAGVGEIRLPQAADSEHLLQLPELQHIHRKQILLVKGEGGRELLQRDLTQAGAIITPIAIYRRQIPHYPEAEIRAIWQNDAVDIILSTSTESLNHLCTLMGNEGLAWLRTKPVLVLSERMVGHAQTLGLTNTLISPPDRIVASLIEFARKKA